MVDVTGTAAAANFSDAMHNGFRTAMERVTEYETLGCKTLVDSMAEDGWTNWDQSNELASVIDSEADFDFAEPRLAA